MRTQTSLSSLSHVKVSYVRMRTQTSLSSLCHVTVSVVRIRTQRQHCLHCVMLTSVLWEWGHRQHSLHCLMLKSVMYVRMRTQTSLSSLCHMLKSSQQASASPQKQNNKGAKSKHILTQNSCTPSWHPSATFLVSVALLTNAESVLCNSNKKWLWVRQN